MISYASFYVKWNTFLLPLLIRFWCDRTADIWKIFLSWLWFLRDVPFKMQLQKNHTLQKLNHKYVHSMYQTLPKSQWHLVKVILVARPLFMPVEQEVVQTRAWCIYEWNMCSSWNINLHRRLLLLFVKHSFSLIFFLLCKHERMRKKRK
jgi:hypothetical protein